jgi:hypothetical protein
MNNTTTNQSVQLTGSTLFLETDTPELIKKNIFETFKNHNVKMSNELWLFVTNSHRARYKGAVLQVRTALPPEIEILEDNNKRDWISSQKESMQSWTNEFESVGVRAKLEYRGCCGEACFNCVFSKK